MDDVTVQGGPPNLPPLQKLEGYEAPTSIAAPAVPLSPATVLVAAVCALSSGIALVVTIVAHLDLSLASSFVMVPAFIAFLAVTVIVRRHEQALFFVRLQAGLVAGVLGTIAYDGLRFAVENAGLSSANSFRAIRVFGMSLTAQPIDAPGAIAAGWTFHVVNGIGFAVAFVMVMSGRRLYWGVLYAMALETAMVTLYPGWLQMTPSAEFLTLSVLGHVAYGAVVGAIAERTA
jgi:hypothetical protein